MKNIYIPKWMIILSNVDKGNLLKISHEASLAYSHAHTLVKDMESDGILIVTKDGKSNKLILTKKGRQLFNAIESIKSIIDSIDAEKVGR